MISRILAFAASITLGAFALPLESAATPVALQVDEPVFVDVNTGTLGTASLTLASQNLDFEGTLVNDSGGYSSAARYGTLAAAPGTIGDFIDLSYSQTLGDSDTVTITFDDPVRDPIFYISDVDSNGASVTVSLGGTIFTENELGVWSGDTFTAVTNPFRMLQVDTPIAAGTNTGVVGLVVVTITSSGSHFTGSLIDNSPNYQVTRRYGSLTLPAPASGDFLDIGYSQTAGDTDTVTVTFADAVLNPTFFLNDIDVVGASVTVSPGGTTFTNGDDGLWSGNTLTAIASTLDEGAFGAVQYAGSYSAGSSFTFEWDYTAPGASSFELVGLGISTGDGLEAFGAVQYAGSYPAGSSFIFDWDFTAPGTIQSELVAIGIVADPIPASDAGSDQTVDEGEFVTLDGTASNDPNGDPLDFSWLQIAGTAVSLSDSAAAQPTFYAPYVSSNTTLTFELTVDDGSGPSDPSTVDITVVNVNTPPTSDAGDDSTIKEGAVATLDGSNSFDPEGDTPLDYTWTQVAGPSVALLPDDTAVSPSFTAPLGVGTVLTFELAVGDGKETGATDSVNVTVVENSSPSANAGADQTVDEGTLVGLDGTSSNDPDGGDTLSFQWTQVAGTAAVLSDETSAAPTFDAPSVPVGGEDLVFDLVVSDDDPVNPKSSTPDSVTVSVRNANDPPICDLGRSTCPSSKLDKGDGCLLWPPNHKMVSVEIAGVTDPNNDGVTIEITGVTQDEPVDGQGDGDSSPDAVIQLGNQADSVLLRSERTGLGGAQENGRVYVMSFTADDGIDSCTGAVTVGVPHDRKDTPVDDGQVFDSTMP